MTLELSELEIRMLKNLLYCESIRQNAEGEKYRRTGNLLAASMCCRDSERAADLNRKIG